jgi:hypothetical protein
MLGSIEKFLTLLKTKPATGEIPWPVKTTQRNALGTARKRARSGRQPVLNKKATGICAPVAVGFKQENTWLLPDHRRTQPTTTTAAILNIKLCAILSEDEMYNEATLS